MQVKSFARSDYDLSDHMNLKCACGNAHNLHEWRYTFSRIAQCVQSANEKGRCATPPNDNNPPVKRRMRQLVLYGNWRTMSNEKSRIAYNRTPGSQPSSSRHTHRGTLLRWIQFLGSRTGPRTNFSKSGRLRRGSASLPDQPRR